LGYLVRWGCFITDESLTPTEAAKAARERCDHPENQAWHVFNLDNKESVVVDLHDGTTKGPKRSRVNGKVQDNVA